MDQSRSPLEKTHSVLALYGVREDSTSIERFFYSSLEWMERSGGMPNRVSVTYVDSSPEIFQDYEHWRTRHRRSSFRNLLAFELYLVQPQSKRGWADPILEARYHRNNCLGNFAYWLMGSGCVLPTHSPAGDSEQDIIECLAPEYGIAYTMPVSFGPAAYAIGQYVSRPDADTAAGTELGLRISRWGSVAVKKRLYQRGLLRGVYPRNYLTRIHLAQMVGRMRLSDWISQTSDRGLLSSFNHTLTLWSVPQDQLQAIELHLWEAGIIFDWRRDS